MENWNIKQFLVDMYMRNLNTKLLRPFEGTMICKPTERSVQKLLKVNGSRIEVVHFWHYVGKAQMCLGGSRFCEKL